MFKSKQRRFRRRTNGRNNMPHHNNSQGRMRSNQFSNGHSRGNFRSQLSAEKSFEKYTSLAKEAMSAGDKTLSENYLQHADHFMRIIEDKNKNRSNIGNKPIEENKNLSDNNTSQNKTTNIDQNEEIKRKT